MLRFPPERSRKDWKGKDGYLNSQLLLLENCGHYPFVEQPEKTTQAILEFVKAQEKR